MLNIPVLPLNFYRFQNWQLGPLVEARCISPTLKIKNELHSFVSSCPTPAQHSCHKNVTLDSLRLAYDEYNVTNANTEGIAPSKHCPTHSSLSVSAWGAQIHRHQTCLPASASNSSSWKRTADRFIAPSTRWFTSSKKSICWCAWKAICRATSSDVSFSL